jgi:hypothetical protein
MLLSPTATAQIAHSFQFYHGAQLAEVSGAEEAEAERRLSTYTVPYLLTGPPS